MLKALFFDLDGTLLDTEGLILTCMRHATSTVLGYVPPDDLLRDMIGIPLIKQMRRLDEERAEELVRVYRAHNESVHDDLIKGFPHMESTLVALKNAGYRLAVVTSKMTLQAIRGLRFFGLDGHFEFVQGSDATERHKPEPDPLLFAAKTMELAPEQCAYIGDSPYDMQSARAANMLAVAALWGMFPRERLIQAGAQKEAAHIEDLITLFEPEV